MSMNVTGRCHCGRISYEAIVDAKKVTLCHCTDCQTLTGSAYRATVPASAETFTLHGSPPSTYVKTAESGARRVHAFCPQCGAPIYSASIDGPKTYSLRVGCLDQRSTLRPSRQIWCRSALPWAMSLEDVTQALKG
jgi:hypothetical protein